MPRSFVPAGRAGVRALLVAHEEVVRWSSLRVALIHGLAVMGALAWAEQEWPALLPRWLHGVGSKLWLGATCALAVVAALEVRWRVRWKRLVRQE